MNQTGWQIFVEVPGKAPIELPTGESVIGRSRACIVQIAETTVSRQHAIFVVEPGKVKLRDLGSSNGTFVNGQRVDGEMPLGDGDRVVVGEAELILRMLAPLGPSEATAKMVIPPLSAPLKPASPAAAAPSSPTSPPSMPAPPAPRAGTASGSHAPWTPTPLSRNPAPPALAPAPVFAPSVPSPLTSLPQMPAPPAFAPSAPTAPAASAAASAGGAAPKGGELLSSIRDIDLAPVPSPLPKKAAAAAAAAVAASAGPASGKIEPAGFWLRAVAYLLDMVPFVILSIAQVVVALYISPNLGTLIFFILPVYGLVLTFVLPAIWGTTPGKRLMKLWIVSETTSPGQGLGWATAGLRFVGYLACSATAGLGYLLVAFSARKQGLHDLIAKTNVVRKRPASA